MRSPTESPPVLDRPQYFSDRPPVSPVGPRVKKGIWCDHKSRTRSQHVHRTKVLNHHAMKPGNQSDIAGISAIISMLISMVARNGSIALNSLPIGRLAAVIAI